MKVLVRFYVYCGRMGSLDGLFICTKEDYDKVMGRNVYFDEPLGKHSEYDIDLDPENTKIISDNQEVIRILEDEVGADLSGFNVVDMALEAMEWEDDEEEE